MNTKLDPSPILKAGLSIIPPNATGSRHSVTITTDGNRQAEAGHSNSLRRLRCFQIAAVGFYESRGGGGSGKLCSLFDARRCGQFSVAR